MKFRAIWCVAVVTTVLSHASAAQVPSPGAIPVKKCDDPKVPIGKLPKAIGTVSFRLAKDGKPDTASLAVTKVLGLSVAGFRSVVARQMSGCKFDVNKVALTSPASVLAQVTIDPATVTIGSADVTVDPGVPLALEHFDPPRDTMPFALGDRRVEELPRPLTCAVPVKGPTLIHASGATMAQAQADAQNQVRIANEQYNATNGGRLTAIVRIGVDGKPGSQIRVVELTNPAAGQSLGDRIGACKYAPARVLGVAVPALIQLQASPSGVQ